MESSKNPNEIKLENGSMPVAIAEKFIKKLQDATGNKALPKKFWGELSSQSGTPTFKDVLDKYAKYYQALDTKEQRDQMSTIFWDTINALGGTPIIEANSDKTCNVYFLFPKNNIAKSEAKDAKEGAQKNLYLQGDFHGYNSIRDEQQRLLELSDTGIMWRQDTMPKDSVVVYQYVQAEPQGDVVPQIEHSPFFTNEGDIVHTTTPGNSPKISCSLCEDEFSRHNHPYRFKSKDRVFRVSTDSAYLPGDPINWRNLLSTSTKTSNDTRAFEYHATLYSDKNDGLHHNNAEVTDFYHDALQYSNGYNLSLMTVSSFNSLDTTKLEKKPYLIKDVETGTYKIWGYKNETWQVADIELKDPDSLKIPSEWQPNQTIFVTTKDPLFDILEKGHTPDLPYAAYTRAVQVFTPTSGNIDDIVVISDGTPYLITGILDHFEKMVREKRPENKLSPNTALVFINPMPGIKETLEDPAEIKAYNANPDVQNPGMGVRFIDYHYRVNQYADFIEHKLFPELKRQMVNVPEDRNHRFLVGSSLSGTASVYIGLTRPELFGVVVAQSPSPANREILSKEIKNHTSSSLPRNILLSCGEFECPARAAANDNLGYAMELQNKLGLPLQPGPHGHQFVAWGEELEHLLPTVLKPSQTLDEKEVKIPTAAIDLKTPDYNKMTFHEFDQSENGVRKLIKAKKFEEAAVAITNYLSNVKDLTSYQKCLLNWHAGQTYAKCGKNDLAIHYFNLAAKEQDEMIKIFGPAASYYYEATVAFLNKDRVLLEKQLQEIMKIPIKDYPLSNVVLVPGLVHDMFENFNASYSNLPDIPSLPPLPAQNSWSRIEAKTMQEEGIMVFEYRVKLEIEKMLQMTNDRFGNKFDRFCKAVGEDGLRNLKTPKPLASSEKNFLVEHRDLDYPPSGLAIKRRQALTAILSSEKGIEALEQKIISLKDILEQPHPHHLRALFSEHGFTALKEGLISPKDALRFGENSSQYLEVLCTENGLAALKNANAQGNLVSFKEKIIEHANKFNNAGVLEHSLKTGIPLEKVQADIEKEVQRPKLM